MKRRMFSSLVAGAVLLPLRGNAQGQARRLRLGILRPTASFSNEPLVLAFRQLGYAEGQTLILNEQDAGQDPAALREIALDMAQRKPDVMLAVGAAATDAAQKATAVIPIVFVGDFDPLALKFVPNLARPGRNTTGLLIAPEGTLAARRLEFLKEAVPAAKRIAFLLPDDPGARGQVEEARAVAVRLGVELAVVTVRGGRYDDAFAGMVEAGAEALLVGAHASFVRDGKPIIELASKHRLPAIYDRLEQAREGGLMAYGPNRDKLYARVALYIDRIFKGENPGDLPVEMPAAPELVLNLRTVRALDLAFPPALLSRAGELVQ